MFYPPYNSDGVVYGDPLGMASIGFRGVCYGKRDKKDRTLISGFIEENGRSPRKFTYRDRGVFKNEQR